MKKTALLLICITLLLSHGACDGGGDSTADAGGGTGADGDSDADSDSDGDSDGDGDTDGDTDDGAPGEECGSTIVAVIRDFSTEHPDFETYSGSTETTGLVRDTLNQDNKPVFASTHGSGQFGQQLTSNQDFVQWYTDVPGVNHRFEYEIELSYIGNGYWEYNSSAFFPLTASDGFGNQGNDMNFHFTTEIALRFTYKGGEIFRFRGDDDLWMFIDGKLAMDLGGLHPAVEGEVNLDTLGLDAGNEYSMRIFHAERHTSESNFRITTTIDCFEPGTVVK